MITIPSTRNKVKNYLSNKEMRVLKWVAQSPDLNPIENAWRQVKQRIAKRQHKAKNLDDVFAIAKEEYFAFLISNLDRVDARQSFGLLRGQRGIHQILKRKNSCT